MRRGQTGELSHIDGLIMDVGDTIAFEHSYELKQKTIDVEAAAVMRHLAAYGKRLVLCTNTGAYETRWPSLERAGVDHLVSVLLSSYALGVRKPDPVMYELALTAVQVPRERVLFVGDHPNYDVAAPMAVLGVAACLVWDPGRTDASVPEVPQEAYTVRTVRELLPLLGLPDIPGP